MIKISVIVPIYKTNEAFLRECLESLLQQTMNDLEFIMVDDGSPDCTASICDEYIKRDTRFLYIHQINQGVSSARNIGLEKAAGKYILFLDADDKLPQDACRILFMNAEKYNTDIMLFGHICFTESQEVIHTLNETIFFDENSIKDLQKNILNPSGRLLTISPAGTVGKLFLHDFLTKNELKYIPGLKRMQDNVFCLTAYQKTSKIVYFDYVGYLYRIHSNSACNKYNPQIFNILEDALRELGKCICSEARVYLSNLLYCKTITILEYEYIHIYFRNRNNPQSRSSLVNQYRQLIELPLYKDALQLVDTKLLSRRFRVLTMLLRKRHVKLVWFLLDIEQSIRGILKLSKKI